MKRGISLLIGLTIIIGGIVGYGFYKNSQNKAIEEISIHANYVKYDTVDELDKASELIVVGSTDKAFLDRKHITTYMPNKSISDYYTLTDIKIKSIIKNINDTTLKQGQKLEIIEPAGVIVEDNKKKIFKDESYEPITPNINYIFFLKKNTEGKYSIINMYRGRFETDNSIKPKSLQETEDSDFNASYNKMKSDVLTKYSDKISKIK